MKYYNKWKIFNTIKHVILLLLRYWWTIILDLLQGGFEHAEFIKPLQFFNRPRMKVAIIPGNGAGDVFHANWYGWAHKQINKMENVSCDLCNMPDPITARESIWIPFMREQMQCGEDTVIIGHSSGAEAAMRFAEKYKVKGIILVSGLIIFVFFRKLFARYSSVIFFWRGGGIYVFLLYTWNAYELISNPEIESHMKTQHIY